MAFAKRLKSGMPLYSYEPSVEAKIKMESEGECECECMRKCENSTAFGSSRRLSHQGKSLLIDYQRPALWECEVGIRNRVTLCDEARLCGYLGVCLTLLIILSPDSLMRSNIDISGWDIRMPAL